MPALLFANDEMLRIALASGAISPAVAALPTRGGADDAGRVWVELPSPYCESPSSIRRVGASGLAAGLPLRALHSLYQLVSLRRSTRSEHTGHWLIELPDTLLASIIARVRTVNSQSIELRMLPRESRIGRCWITLQSVGSTLIPELDSAADVRIYFPIAPDVWARSGCDHPLANAIVPPVGSLLLLEPRREWRVVTHGEAIRSPVGFRIASRAILRSSSDKLALHPIRVPLGLKRRAGSDHEELWVLDDDGGIQFAAILRGADEQALHNCRIASVVHPARKRRIVIIAGQSRVTAGLSPPLATAYGPFTRVPGLFIPTGYQLLPVIRPSPITAALAVKPGGMAWIEPHAQVHRTERITFKPASQLVDYQVPEMIRLEADWGTTSPFTFEAIGPILDSDRSNRVHRGAIRPQTAQSQRSTTRSRAGEGWVARSIDRLIHPFRSSRVLTSSTTRIPSVPIDPPDRDIGGDDSNTVSRLVDPANVLTQLSALEERLFHQLPYLARTTQSDLWASAAELAAAAGRFADAGLYWTNAIWASDQPPRAWWDAWLRTEIRAANLTHAPQALGEWLTRTASPVPPRLAAAYLAWSSHTPGAGASRAEVVRRFILPIEDPASNLPLRAAWLARLAVAGDPLGLARWRDSAIGRLANGRTDLDCDLPGFIRHHGRDSDHDQSGREWLKRMRGPVQAWLIHQASPRGLQWFGLDAEIDSTAAYIDLMFAWAAARLGDRALARDWEAAAAGVLDHATGAGAAAVHAVLLAAFRHRIHDAAHNRVERPGLPPDLLPAYRQLAEFPRYAVDRFRRASAILEPIDRVNPYGGRDAVGLYGTDRLGERLRRLNEVAAADELDAEVRALLALAAGDPTPGVLPRVGLAAIAAAPRLPPDTAREVLIHIPTALKLVPEWYWAIRGRPTPHSAGLEEFLGCLIDSAAHAAAVCDAPDIARDLIVSLTGPSEPPAAVTRTAIGPVAGRLFHSLRRMGLQTEAGELLIHLAGPIADRAEPAAQIEQLGLAIGWFTIGNVDKAVQMLDDARIRLVPTGPDPPRLRAKLAVAYVTALGHAPPPLALARLEELIRHPDKTIVHGSENRYFSLAALEQVDAIVRAATGDAVAFDPLIRGWLADSECSTRRRIDRDLDRALATAGFGVQ